ncbi:unnamed protein product [Moneuplotes crassus]|uniref:Uncharacterized protein n=1 Tax=Euplotes crassus TaxID=5936 RepID=A0AAD1UH06_EUPCR|nr:unnamed protein product [Moneuplotes crassus]
MRSLVDDSDKENCNELNKPHFEAGFIPTLSNPHPQTARAQITTFYKTTSRPGPKIPSCSSSQARSQTFIRPDRNYYCRNKPEGRDLSCKTFRVRRHEDYEDDYQIRSSLLSEISKNTESEYSGYLRTPFKEIKSMRAVNHNEEEEKQKSEHNNGNGGIVCDEEEDSRRLFNTARPKETKKISRKSIRLGKKKKIKIKKKGKKEQLLSERRKYKKRIKMLHLAMRKEFEKLIKKKKFKNSNRPFKCIILNTINNLKSRNTTSRCKTRTLLTDGWKVKISNPKPTTSTHRSKSRSKNPKPGGQSRSHLNSNTKSIKNSRSKSRTPSISSKSSKPQKSEQNFKKLKISKFQKKFQN